MLIGIFGYGGIRFLLTIPGTKKKRSQIHKTIQTSRSPSKERAVSGPESIGMAIIVYEFMAFAVSMVCLNDVCQTIRFNDWLLANFVESTT